MSTGTRTSASLLFVATLTGDQDPQPGAGKRHSPDSGRTLGLYLGHILYREDAEAGMKTVGGQASQHMSLEKRAQAGPGADLVLEGGGVKGIGLVGAVLTLHEAGFVFPRVGGTSAGAIVAALIAAYQARNVPLTQLQTDMDELDYTKFTRKTWAERHLGLIGDAAALVSHQGLYASSYLQEWLTTKLEPLGVRTFADLKITGDDGPGRLHLGRRRAAAELPGHRFRPDRRPC